MATLALSLAGQFVGGLRGRADRGDHRAGAGGAGGERHRHDAVRREARSRRRGTISRLQGSSEGGAVPRLYGWSRLSGNIIWARELELLGGREFRRQGHGRGAGAGRDRRQLRRRLLRGRGAAAGAHLGRWAIARYRGADAAVLSRHRGPAARWADRGDAGRRRRPIAGFATWWSSNCR